MSERMTIFLFDQSKCFRKSGAAKETGFDGRAAILVCASSIASHETRVS